MLLLPLLLPLPLLVSFVELLTLSALPFLATPPVGGAAGVGAGVGAGISCFLYSNNRLALVQESEEGQNKKLSILMQTPACILPGTERAGLRWFINRES